MKNLLIFTSVLLLISHTTIVFADEPSTLDASPTLLIVDPFVNGVVGPNIVADTLESLVQSFSSFDRLMVSSKNVEVNAAYFLNPNIDFVDEVLKKNLRELNVIFLVLPTIDDLGDGLVLARAQVIDTRNNRVIATSFKSVSTKLGFSGEIRYFTDDVVQALNELDSEIMMKAPDAHVPAPVVSLTLTSPLEGLQISLPDGSFVGAIENGSFLYLSPPVVNGGLIYLKLSKEGYVPTTRSYLVLNKDVPIQLGEINIESYNHLKIMWHLNYVTSAGVLYQGFLEPDWQYWEAGLNLTVKTLEVYSFANKSKTTYFRFLPELVAGFGSYVLSPPENFFRLNLGTRAGLLFNISTVKDANIGTDLFFQPLVLGFELNFPYFTISTDISYRFYLGVFETSLFNMGFQDASPRVDFTFSLKGGAAK